MLTKIAPSHEEAKRKLQEKYFADVDPSIFPSFLIKTIIILIYYAYYV